MPELPEVETVVRALAPRIKGRRILSAEFRCQRILRGGDPDKLAARLAGKKILSVSRAGKYILIPLEGGQYLTVHLGMTGKLLVGGKPERHTHAIFTLDRGGSSISDYVDPEGRKGWFQLSHRVYQRTGEPCVTCRTPIRRILVVQRSSHFCPKCQRR